MLKVGRQLENEIISQEKNRKKTSANKQYLTRPLAPNRTETYLVKKKTCSSFIRNNHTWSQLMKYQPNINRGQLMERICGLQRSNEISRQVFFSFYSVNHPDTSSSHASDHKHPIDSSMVPHPNVVSLTPPSPLSEES